MEGNVVAKKIKCDVLCRVCLSIGEDMQALFEEDNIIQQIEYCTGLLLSPEPNLPSHICRTCLGHLNTAHSFKSTCLTSDYSLRSSKPIETFPDTLHTLEYTTTLVKVEHVDTDSDGLDKFSDWGDETKQSEGVKVKKEPEDSPDAKPVRVSKKRGPYKKGNPRPRRRKYKFRRLFCATCEIQFATKKEKDAHQAAAHRKDPEAWICEICGKVFASQGSHYTHVRAHAPAAHGCAHCDYRTRYRSDLTKHLRIHTDEKQYQCAICPRSFHNSSNLLSHVRRLHERLKPYACPQCSKRFFDGTKLRRHLDSHADIKRYQCELCSSGFTRRCYWKKHMLTQHGVAIPPQRPGRQRDAAETGGGGQGETGGDGGRQGEGRQRRLDPRRQSSTADQPG